MKYKGDRTFCRIGDRNILRENITIHRGTVPESETVIGSDCFLLAGAHVGHNSHLGDRVTVINNTLLGGHVTLEDGVTTGGDVGIHQFVRVGEMAMLAGTARVVQDVLPFALVGVHGKHSGINSVGLRRASTPREDVLELREAYRRLFRGASFAKAVEEVIPTLSTPSGLKLAEFLRRPSKRGVAGRPRRAAGSRPRLIHPR